MSALSRRPLPRLARYTWARQGPAVFLVGLSLGLVGLAPFAVKRSLGGGRELVPLLIAFWQTIWILAPAAGPLLARADPQRAWRRIAILSYAPLLLVAFLAVVPTGADGRGDGSAGWFIALLVLHYAMSIFYIPHRGALLRTNYAPEVRGRMYALLALVNVVGLVCAAKGGGYLLNRDPRWIRLLFPLAALFGGTGLWLFGRIRWRGQRRVRVAEPLAATPWRALRAAWSETIRILRVDRAFRVYETGFMLYGIGFLMSWALVVLYAEEGLALSYDDWTWSQGFAAPAAQLLTMVLWGRLADRLGVVHTTAVAFFLLLLFLIGMTRVQTAGQLVAAYFLFGAAMSGVDVGWNLGPIHFAPDGRAHMYTAVHFSLVGVRSVVAPFLGYLMVRWFSFQAGFWVAAGFMALATLTIGALARRVILTK